jgi:hypothetical protein
MSTDLALREQQAAPLAIGSLRLNGLDDLARVAKAVAASGMFKDANTPDKVAVKMFFALTMGFSPIAGLTGVDLINGNPTPNAHFWAAAIEDSPLYDYDVRERTNERCTVVFSRWDERKGEWRKRGEITWTIEDAKRAKLAGKDVWTQYPRAMLWSRCMTEGGRTYCPGLFGGVRAYAPEELGGAPVPSLGEPRPLIDGITGEVIEAPEVVAESEPATVGESAPEPETVKLVTRLQVERLFTIARKAKLPEATIRAAIRKHTGQESSKAIPVTDYDAVIKELQEAALDLDAAHTEDAPVEEPETGQVILEQSPGRALADDLKAKHGDPA